MKSTFFHMTTVEDMLKVARDAGLILKQVPTSGIMTAPDPMTKEQILQCLLTLEGIPDDDPDLINETLRTDQN